MKTAVSLSALIGLCAPLFASAADFYDSARVISVSEHTDQYVQPRQVCDSKPLAAATADQGAGVANQPVRRCRAVDAWGSKVTGYVVSYEYKGHLYTDTITFNPGDIMRLRVRLVPSK